MSTTAEKEIEDCYRKNEEANARLRDQGCVLVLKESGMEIAVLFAEYCIAEREYFACTQYGTELKYELHCDMKKKSEKYIMARSQIL